MTISTEMKYVQTCIERLFSVQSFSAKPPFVSTLRTLSTVNQNMTRQTLWIQTCSYSNIYIHKHSASPPRTAERQHPASSPHSALSCRGASFPPKVRCCNL